MLPLVVADRDDVGLVEQDVARHQHRVGEERRRRRTRARRDLSLNCVIRPSWPKLVTEPSSQAASACAGTWLCAKTVERSGSRPVANSIAARSSVFSRKSCGSYSTRDRVQVDDAEEALAALLRRGVLAEAADQVAERACRPWAGCRRRCACRARFVPASAQGHNYTHADGYRRLPRAPDRDGRAGVLRAGGRGRRAPGGGGRERARQPRPRRDRDRRDRRARAARDAAARGLPGRRAGAADPEAVQARLARAPPRPDRDRGARPPARRPATSASSPARARSRRASRRSRPRASSTPRA